METLRIGLISTNTFPTPPADYGGEVAWYYLAKSLDEMGHTVDLYATPGSWKPPHGDIFYMESSYNTHIPWFWECEQRCYDFHRDQIHKADVVHDGSHTKRISEVLWKENQRKQVSTLIGSVWTYPQHGGNVIVWSEAMRQMGLKGWTGYEGGPYEHMGGKTGSLRDAHVVNGCTDTDFYAPDGYEKDDYFLWYSRAHPSKGYQVAIELAKKTGISLKLMHLRPEDAASPDHKQGILHALELAKGADNITFVWLPKGKGHHEMKRKVIQKAKALLYTIQFQECFGLVVVEALACGTPVIAANMGAMPEIIRPGVNGFLFDTAEELEDVVQHVDEVRPEACRKDAVARFDRRVMASNYVKEYRKAMNGEVWGA